jgi:hypothetical protein
MKQLIIFATLIISSLSFAQESYLYQYTSQIAPFEAPFTVKPPASFIRNNYKLPKDGNVSSNIATFNAGQAKLHENGKHPHSERGLIEIRTLGNIIAATKQPTHILVPTVSDSWMTVEESYQRAYQTLGITKTDKLPKGDGRYKEYCDGNLLSSVYPWLKGSYVCSVSRDKDYSFQYTLSGKIVKLILDTPAEVEHQLTKNEKLLITKKTYANGREIPAEFRVTLINLSTKQVLIDSLYVLKTTKSGKDVNVSDMKSLGYVDPDSKKRLDILDSRFLNMRPVRYKIGDVPKTDEEVEKLAAEQHSADITTPKKSNAIYGSIAGLLFVSGIAFLLRKKS